jgi:hypothetical protein
MTLVPTRMWCVRAGVEDATFTANLKCAVCRLQCVSARWRTVTRSKLPPTAGNCSCNRCTSLVCLSLTLILFSSLSPIRSRATFTGSSPTREEIRFWIIDALTYVVTTRYQFPLLPRSCRALSPRSLPLDSYATFSEPDRVAMRLQLMVFVRDVASRVPQSHGCKGKLSLLLVRIVKHDYPEKWKSFFSYELRAPCVRACVRACASSF